QRKAEGGVQPRPALEDEKLKAFFAFISHSKRSERLPPAAGQEKRKTPLSSTGHWKAREEMHAFRPRA
ncbi:hypothetical protein, partial [Sporosarcina sp. USHLN248]|uniref:hypothetical protein n=1 Tax=Sporosarcina sp. USHLN248 TaxID=3081300 RepID=UPI00301AFFF6